MNFKTAARLGGYIAKEYAENFFELLVNYDTISASEAASRLNLHINTAKDFLEGLASLGIVSKQEVSEGKRPYHRYALITDRISIDFDLTSTKKTDQAEDSQRRYREKSGANARFATSRDGKAMSSVAVWEGSGRKRKERLINLTRGQGLFLFHLPFPDGAPLTMDEIIIKAGIETAERSEILDIVEWLVGYNVVETLA